MDPLITFKCPECGQQIEGPYAKTVCPTCNHEFIPALTPRAVNREPPDLEALQQENCSKRAWKIRVSAERFGQLAMLFFIVAALVLLVAGVVVVGAAEGGGDESAGAAKTCSVSWFCVKAGAFCYLISQVMHIRANTEK